MRDSLQAVDNFSQLGLDLDGDLMELRVFYRLHRGNRVNCCYLYLSLVIFKHYDVTGQHGSDLFFDLECLISIGRIAGTENFIFFKIHIEFLFQGLPDIYFRKDPKALLFQLFLNPGDGLIKGTVYDRMKVVAQV